MRARHLAVVLGGLLLAMTAGGTARAGIDIDFGASIQMGDDTDLYFAISSRYFDQDRHAVEGWGTRFGDSDDLAVALFVSRHSGKSPDFIFDLRRQGNSWWEIAVRLGVPVDAWFVPVERDPGPPYGKAYGHWKKHRHALRLSDADAANLVAVRMIHEYYDLPVEVAMEWRSSGRDLRTLMAGEYGKRHGKSKRDGRGHGHGQNKTKNKDKRR